MKTRPKFEYIRIILKKKTFWDIRSITFMLTVRLKDQRHSNVCMLNMQLSPAAAGAT